jgi:hypothetical protein
MVEVKFKDKDLKLVLNNYRLYTIAEELGVATPAEAIEAINEVLTRPEGGVISTKGMKGFATIFKHMVYEGTKPAPDFSESDWFDILSDDASQGVVEEFFNFLPPLETQKKNKEQEKQ